jgi:hypothetical protein
MEAGFKSRQKKTETTPKLHKKHTKNIQKPNKNTKKLHKIKAKMRNYEELYWL